MRVNVARSFSPGGTARRSPSASTRCPARTAAAGPTGVGDDWVRIGPIKLFLDGGMLNGTAYMRKPWPQRRRPTRSTEDDYRGLLFVQPEQLQGRLRGGGEAEVAGHRPQRRRGGMDVLLDAYEFANRIDADPATCASASRTPTSRRSATSNAARSSASCADVQPAWLYKDGNTLLQGARPGADALVPAVQDLARSTRRSAAAATTCCASTRSTAPTRGTRGSGIWEARDAQARTRRRARTRASA